MHYLLTMIKHSNNYIIIVDYALNTYKSSKNILGKSL